MAKLAIALGMFDSVHIGHKAVLKGVLKSGLRSIVLTFDKIPYKTGGVVLTNEERCQKLLKTGVDTVEIFSFSDVKDLSPLEFLDSFAGNCSVALIACGFNFRFGKNAVGDTALIRKYCEEKGIEFFEAEEVKRDGETVSTTYIKKLLAEGELALANELLEEPFSITSPVIKGDKRGRTLGFPTINQLYPEDKTRLKSGVYRTRVTVGLKTFDGVTDIGCRPTFEREIIAAETFILGFNGNLYGKNITVSFEEYLREEKKFSSVEELRTAIMQDVLRVKKNTEKA